ncbi:T9SS type A sorting domain-containing protein [Bacteroidota bacterium]
MKKQLFLFLVIIAFPVLVSAQPCLPDGITFTTQSQIDSFQINYPGCTEIEGDVTIDGNQITNLNGLSVLTSIGGSLTVKYTETLTSLGGLDNVTSIWGWLNIKYNQSLTSLTGLDNVTFIENLEIRSNPLTSLAGLDNVTSIGGSLYVSGNGALTSLAGLDNVTSIGNRLEIVSNHSLTSLTGLDNVTSIGGSLEVNNNESLASIAELDNVTSIDGSIRIFANDALTSLAGLDNVTSIGGSLSFSGNEALTSLAGLDNVTSIGGSLVLSDNESLTSLAGLNNVTSIGEDLWIGEYALGEWRGNPSLTSLQGLNNLSSIGGTLAVLCNISLTSLTGFDNIDAGSISHLFICINQLLSTCEVQSVCDYLSSPNGTIDIHDNAPGCNSPEEVQEACEAVAIPSVDAQAVTLFYPNPAESFIFVKGTNQSVVQQVSIYNQMGQRVLQKEQAVGMIDVSRLLPGMYVIEIFSGELRTREKLIIQ